MEELITDSRRGSAPPVIPESEEEYTDSRERVPFRRDRGWEREEYGERRKGPESLSSDYVIDFNEWFRYAKAHYSAILGPMVGYTVIYILIALVLSIIPFPCGNLIQLFLDPPLQAGFTIVCLAQLKGRNWTFGDFFSGFQWYGSLLGNHLLVGLMGLGIILPGAVFLIAASQGRDEVLLAVAIGFAAINLMVFIFVMLRTSLFCTPLIVEQNFGAIEAIQGSWILTRDHFWSLLGISLILGLINLGGFLLCGIGLLFTIPLTELVITAGYLLITSPEKPVDEPQGSYREFDR